MKKKTIIKKHFIKKEYTYNNKLRLCIFKSNKHLYVQLINDKIKNTLLSSCTIQKDFLSKNIIKTNLLISYFIGMDIGIKIRFNNIINIYLNNNYYTYAGKIISIIEGIKNIGIHI